MHPDPLFKILCKCMMYFILAKKQYEEKKDNSWRYCYPISFKG